MAENEKKPEALPAPKQPNPKPQSQPKPLTEGVDLSHQGIKKGS